MIRSFAFAFTALLCLHNPLSADDPQKTASSAKTIQENEKERPRTTAYPPLFRSPDRQDESEFDTRLRDALTSAADAESLQSIQQQLNGTWKYVAVIETDDIETYEDRDVQLVIHDDLCGVFEEGKLSGREPDRIRILTTSEPIVYTQASEQIQKIRFGKRVGTFLSYGLLRVEDDHLLLTSTPSIPKADYMGYGVSLPDFFDGVDKIPAYRKYLPYLFPNTFSPEGTRNRQVILRRVSDSTELLDRAANRRPDGEEDLFKLTWILQQAREQEERLKQVHLRIAARVSSLHPRAELSPHTDETLQQTINDWREKHSQAEPTDRTVFRDLIEALAVSPSEEDQQFKNGIPLSVDLQGGKSVTQIGKEIVGVTDGDVSVYINRQRETDLAFQRGIRIPHHRLSEFRFSLETVPYKATKSYTEGIESNLVGESVVQVHLKKATSTLWRPGENIPWVRATRRDIRKSGTVSGAYSRSRTQTDEHRQSEPAPQPTPPPEPPDLLSYRYNTETNLVEEYADYRNGTPQYKAFSIGAVKVEQPAGKDASPTRFPRFFIEVFYEAGIPREFIARRIDSVTLGSEELSTVVPAQAGATLFLIRRDDWPEQIKLQQHVDDVLAHARQILQAKYEK